MQKNDLFAASIALLLATCSGCAQEPATGLDPALPTAAPAREDDVTEVANASSKVRVINYREQLVDDCVIIIRPTPPGLPTMIVSIDYEPTQDFFVARSDRPMGIGAENTWKQGVVDCSSSTTIVGAPYLTGLKDVYFRIVRESEVSPTARKICIATTTDSSGLKFAKEFASINFDGSIQTRLQVDLDNDLDPTALWVYFNKFKYEIPLRKIQ